MSIDISDGDFVLAIGVLLGVLCVLALAAIFAARWEAEERARLPPASTEL